MGTNPRLGEEVDELNLSALSLAKEKLLGGGKGSVNDGRGAPVRSSASPTIGSSCSASK